jgi:hypothetical protein
MRPTKRFNVTETCSSEGSDPTTDTKKIATGNLLDTGEKSFKIGGAMKGRYSIHDDYLNETTVWNWSLKPRRYSAGAAPSVALGTCGVILLIMLRAVSITYSRL